MSDGVDLAKAVGHVQDDQNVSWNVRDLLLYAVGIGAGAGEEDLKWTYELNPGFSAFPTYPVVLAFKGTDTDVNVFAKRMSTGSVPGLPKFDPNRVVHGSQATVILRPLPKISGAGWKLKRRIVGVHENKSGIIVDNESILVDGSGTEYAKLYSSSFHVGAKATGSRFSKNVAGPPAPIKTPSSSPHHTVKNTVTPDQAIVYRLSGDYNPLHIDPSIGSRAGFGGVILHGLASYGIAARAILQAIPGDLTYIASRFTSPVKPGDELETRIWKVGEKNGEVELAFTTVNLTSRKPSLGQGHARVRKQPGSKL